MSTLKLNIIPSLIVFVYDVCSPLNFTSITLLPFSFVFIFADSISISSQYNWFIEFIFNSDILLGNVTCIVGFLYKSYFISSDFNTTLNTTLLFVCNVDNTFVLLVILAYVVVSAIFILFSISDFFSVSITFSSASFAVSSSAFSSCSFETVFSDISSFTIFVVVAFRLDIIFNSDIFLTSSRE